MITNNPIFRRRIEGLGVIGKEQAINWSLSGPMLRAAGVPWDLRKVDHYEFMTILNGILHGRKREIVMQDIEFVLKK